MESELWPEHLYQARCRRVPVLLVNARMSDRSFNRAKGVTWAYRQILQSLAGLAASGQLDLERYLELGIPEKQATCTGNLKLDIDPGPELTDVAKKTLLEEIGFEENLPVILGSSTWPGEEAALLNAFQQLLDEGVDCRLLLVPRHAERRNDVRKILEEQQHPWHFRTDCPSPKNTVKIYVADTTGELRNFTQLATVAFIGKTLPPNEGSQTPIEAAAFGVPSLFGPATSNFRIICSQLDETGASIQITNAKALLPNLRKLLRNPGKLQKMSNAARSWHQTNLGATQRTLDFLSTHLPA